MTPQPSPARRKPALFAIDLAATVLVLLFLIVLALVVIASALQVNEIGGLECAARSAGEACNTGLLAATVFGIIGVTVLGTFLAVGMTIVSLIRRRVLFVWPLGAIVVIVVLYYAGIWLAGVALS